MSRKKSVSRAQVSELVGQGLLNDAIAKRLKCGSRIIAKIRVELGVGPQPRQSPGRYGSSTWTPERIETLRRYWEVERLTAAQIAARFGGRFNRNSVIGAVHRYNLAGRPSPIIRDGRPEAQRSGRKRGGAAGLSAARAVSVVRAPALFAARPAQAKTGANAQPRTVPQAPAPRVDSEPRVSDSGTLSEQRPSAPWDGKPIDQFVIERGQCRHIVVDDPAQLGHVLMCGAPTATGEPFCPACRQRMWAGFKAQVPVAAE